MPVLQHVGHLHRGGERHPAGAPVEGGVAAARLERRRVLPARARLDLDDRVGAGERLGKALGLDPALDEDIAGRFGVDRGGARGRRRVEIDDGILGVDVEDDLLGDILGLFARGGDDRGDGLADIGDAVGGQDGLGDGDIVAAVEKRADGGDAGDVRGGHHRCAGRRLDAEDSRRAPRGSAGRPAPRSPRRYPA